MLENKAKRASRRAEQRLCALSKHDSIWSAYVVRLFCCRWRASLIWASHRASKVRYYGFIHEASGDKMFAES